MKIKLLILFLSLYSITKAQNITADFSANDICAGSAINFTDLSSSSNGAITTWFWDFSDGSTSALQNPSHVFAASCIVYLHVTNSNGDTASVTHPVTVNPIPSASYTASNVCFGNPMCFTDNSAVSDSIDSWFWNFGDGATDTIQDPCHTYSSPGAYNITLNVSSRGCASVVTSTRAVSSIPYVNFNATSACTGDTTLFFNNTSGTVNSWAWNFGDGTTDTVQYPQHIYIAEGIYQVSLTAGNYGCVGSATHLTYVYPNPVASFASSTTCLGNPAFFDDLSSVSASPPGSILMSWNWDFGDGSTSSSFTNPANMYDTTGTYIVELTLTTNNGCVSSVSDSITVVDSAWVNFILNKNISLPYTWDAIPTYSSGIISARWDWGDGSDTIALYPGHVYAAPGFYDICVTAYSSCGDSVIFCRNDSIYKTMSGPLVYINVVPPDPAGIYALNANSRAGIFPNPFSSQATLSTDKFLKGATLNIYDSFGRQVKQINNISGNTITIHRDNLPGGLYFIQLSNGNEISTGKFIIRD